MAAKRLAWFASEKGQQWALTGISCFGCGLLAVTMLPHTFLLKKYKEIVQLYKMGVEVPVPQSVLTLADEVMDDMNISQLERKIIYPFAVFGFDVFHAGTTTSKFGALIGIPSAFSYQSIADVDCQNILVNNEKVNWVSQDGEDLRAALVMSKQAKKFALGREIVMCQTIQPYLNGFYPAGVVCLMYTFTHIVNRRMQLLSRPLALRGILYSITGLFGFGLWALLKDYSNVYYEIQADKQMCLLGKDYLRGGLEFYVNILKRNVALRNLMGKDGEKLFSASGNDMFFIRQKRLPLIHRKSYLELRLRESEITEQT